MTQELSETPQHHQAGVSHMINIRKILMMMLKNWYFYFLGIVISIAGAYFFMKHKIPTYRVETTILIGEEGNPQGAGEDMLQGFALRPGVQNLDNQLLIVRSYSLIRKAVEELPFEIDVYRKGYRSQASFYPMSPIRIEVGEEGPPYDSEFIFQYNIEEENFHLKTSSRSAYYLDSIYTFGQEIGVNGGSFIIHPQPELEDIYQAGGKIFIRFYDKERLTDLYMSRLMVDNATRDGSIISLSLEGPNRIKDVIFLDKLTEVYINNNLEKKNTEALRVTEFISAQLGDVTDSLKTTEKQLMDFRSRNMIMDVSAQAQQIIDQSVSLENEMARLNLERSYFNYLEEYLSKDDNNKAPIAPASMGIVDPLLANLMQELAGLQAEYFSKVAGERNPLQGQLEMRIRNTKNSIKETLMGLKLANQMAIDTVKGQIKQTNAKASGLPIKERQLLGFERQFNLNNALYTFLMQRLAESQIQSASNTPDNEIVDPARASGPVSPIAQLVFAFAFAFALGFPTTFIILKELINNKITCEEDLKLITQLPVVAHFPHSRLSYNTVVLNEPDSRISESFRSLRTRMDFFTRDIKCPIIVLSSSIPGEGKTFAAINLASAYSLAGKKTLLVGMDLRRPMLGKSFDLDTEIGLTDYLIGKKKLNEVIKVTDFKDLSIITSGPIPPNPGELSSSDRARDMFEVLKENYDYIIVDSPPIGVVSDIYLASSLADAVLMMVRHDYTKKNVLSATLAEVQNNGIGGLSILVNDVKALGSSYRYAYKYKYNYKQKK
ncbi:MAG: polysaccharide biosynthesis tyrosine autokinase [Bacteroidales bacterium]|nr:polysaccharide biosynthesis tyrosine autokinase [Bacteroidales bacterium]